MEKNVGKTGEYLNKSTCVYLHSEILRPVRLGVRTPGFHPGSRGSIPLRATKKEKKARAIVLAFFVSKRFLTRVARVLFFLYVEKYVVILSVDMK